MGFQTELWKLFDFIYYASLDEGLTEHEFDHVMIGRFEDTPKPNPDEVMEWKWVDLTTIRRELQHDPTQYTYWFRVSFARFLQAMASRPNDESSAA
jgi:isopentenyl-diphosphate delta-isomerase